MNDAKILAGGLVPSPFDALLGMDQTVLDAIPAAVYVCAADGVVVRYNRRATELWGRSPRPGDTDERFCGAFRLYRLDGQFLPHASTPMETALRTGEPQHDKEVLIERPDGSRVVVRVNIELLRGPGDRVEGAINCFQDITPDAIAGQVASRLAAVVESSEDAIISMDLDGVIASWNAGAEGLYGYSADEVCGKPATILIPPDRHDEEAHILARIRRGERVGHYETTRQRKDGSLVVVSLTVSPVTDADGRVIGASKIARDITRRRLNEQSLARRIKEQDALYRLVNRLQRAQTPADTYEAALDAIVGALGCRRASILLFDGSGSMRFVAWRGLSDGYRKAVDGHSPWRPGEPDPQPVFVEDIDTADASESLKATVRAEGIRGLAFIPVVAQGVLIGKFMTYYDTPHAFDEHETHLSITIARQLGFSLERLRAEEARRIAEAELSEKSAQLDMIMETVPAIIWIAHDSQAQRITGSRYGAEFLRLPTDGNQSLTAPDGERPTHFRVLKDGEELAAEELPVQRAARGEEVLDEELEVAFDDGTSRWELANARPIRDGEGRPIGAVGAALDITERKEAEEHRKLLIDELNHRVKNTLAIVQGLAQQTFRGEGVSPVARNAFEGRLAALASAHNLLTRGNWEKAFLHEIADEAIGGCGPARSRISLDGPPVMLEPKQAGTIAMALHELCTNAMKYGALSNGTGTVAFAWRRSGGPDPRLRLVWRESGGPAVSPPKRRGFGSRMIEQALAQDLQGDVAMDFMPDGLVCTIDAPLPERHRAP